MPLWRTYLIPLVTFIVGWSAAFGAHNLARPSSHQDIVQTLEYRIGFAEGGTFATKRFNLVLFENCPLIIPSRNAPTPREQQQWTHYLDAGARLAPNTCEDYQALERYVFIQ